MIIDHDKLGQKFKEKVVSFKDYKTWHKEKWSLIHSAKLYISKFYN
jgi:hypothetical protein